MRLSKKSFLDYFSGKLRLANKKLFKHRLKNRNLYIFDWKEAANKNEFFDLSLNRIQMINNFEYQSCIN